MSWSRQDATRLFRHVSTSATTGGTTLWQTRFLIDFDCLAQHRRMAKLSRPVVVFHLTLTFVYRPEKHGVDRKPTLNCMLVPRR